MIDDLRPIVKSINRVLEARWSVRQLSNGKWFQIEKSWQPSILKEIIRRYKRAGWIVTRNVELTAQADMKIYLVFCHPKHHTPGIAQVPS